MKMPPNFVTRYRIEAEEEEAAEAMRRRQQQQESDVQQPQALLQVVRETETEIQIEYAPPEDMPIQTVLGFRIKQISIGRLVPTRRNMNEMFFEVEFADDEDVPSVIQNVTRKHLHIFNFSMAAQFLWDHIVASYIFMDSSEREALYDTICLFHHESPPLIYRNPTSLTDMRCFLIGYVVDFFRMYLIDPSHLPLHVTPFPSMYFNTPRLTNF